ncbi:Uncharacterized protein dnl_31340 [Desulfonema limicola]|uniref:Uncharacterized protein n=1 Tax=Desulfonema limicola TaxID=45656 RepID=A0A975B8E7_9BACT|nr:hypothetical protein [Desulfonema limicola]QTA80821.1 Uncharacterized protein dnl_31340 [Desulfonema limicola]
MNNICFLLKASQELDEAACVEMKRQGAKYVAELLSDKSRNEQLEFWIKRTEILISKQKKTKSNKIKMPNMIIKQILGKI